VIDILPNRHKSNLITYFLRFPRAEREKVRVLVMDMWENYRALAWLFPNAKVVVDRYHWVRQIHWALDNVRKNIQRNLSDWWRKYFKRNRFLLYKKFADLDSEQRLVVLNMVERNTDLYNAWQLKENLNNMPKEVFNVFCTSLLSTIEDYYKEDHKKEENRNIKSGSV